MILGIDVWNGYGRIDWHRAAAAGVRFAIVKCTEGNEGRDSRFVENVAGAKAAGIACGAYLFGFPLPERDDKPGRSPVEQARRFYTDSRALGTRRGELPPVLDIEWPARWDKREVDAHGRMIDQWDRWEVTPASIVEWSLRCLDELERLFDRTPIVYTYPHFWQSLGEHGRDPAFASYPLWIANYTHPKDWMPPASARPIVPAPWTDWTIWQFSADGSPVRVPGVPACPLDRNVVRDEAVLFTLGRFDTPVSSPTLPVEVPEMRPDPFEAQIIHPKVPLGRPALDDHDDE